MVESAFEYQKGSALFRCRQERVVGEERATVEIQSGRHRSSWKRRDGTDDEVDR